MLKLLFALIMGLMAGTSISFCDGDDVSEVQDFFERNLKELRVEYKESFHEEWNVNSIDSIKKLYAIDDNHIGYLVDFDTGYLAYGLEYQMYKMETEGEPDFYNHSNRLYYIAGTFMEKNNDNFYLADGRVFYPSAKIGNGLASSDLYHEIESRLDYKGFRINASCTKIPKLKDKYDSSSWGNYKAVSFYQGSTSDCGVIAIMDLLHTFRLSGGKDYTKGLSPSAMREELRGLTNWQGNIAGEGMLPMDLTRGCTNYIGEAGVSLKSTGDYRDDLPEICLYYSLNVANTSHFAMKVGSAQQDYWWVFKTYWDIIVSWASNYYVDSSGMPSSLYESDSCYYLVDQQYRQGAYQLCYGDMLIGVK